MTCRIKSAGGWRWVWTRLDRAAGDGYCVLSMLSDREGCEVVTTDQECVLGQLRSNLDAFLAANPALRDRSKLCSLSWCPRGDGFIDWAGRALRNLGSATSR